MSTRLILLFLTMILITLAFWSSALSLSPVPWPDDSAFFLTGMDLVHWPPVYAMRSQAPFVPSYAIANFNTMPLLPFILGLGRMLGIHTSHGIRIFGLLALAGWAWLMALWIKRRYARNQVNSQIWIGLLPLIALTSPPIRWGATIVRTEVWVGLMWLLILMELDGFFSKRWENSWRLPIFLALSAYFHFEAIAWVAPIALAITLSSPSWLSALKQLLKIAGKTLALLSPWLCYLLWHWELFWTQMPIQFHRLNLPHHPHVDSWHSLFHGIFLTLGNPASYPKFFNLGKILIWSLSVGSIMGGFLFSVRHTALIAALLGPLSAAYLWATKPEDWFTTLIHMTLWPLAALYLPTIKNRIALGLSLVAATTLLVVQLATAFNQWQEIKDVYHWKNYQDWTTCIDQTIGARHRVWQIQWPDVLVQLAGKNPTREYIRAADFKNIDVLIEKNALSSEAIIQSTHWPVNDTFRFSNYSGRPRPFDLEILHHYPWFYQRQYSALEFLSQAQPNQWHLEICQRGPFWAAISLKP